jgi:hypothetical protein
MAALSDSAGDQGSQAVRAYRQPRPDAMASAGLIADYRSAYCTTFVKQPLENRSLRDQGSGRSGCVHQLVIEDAARYREAGRTKGRMSGSREAAVRAGPAGSTHLEPFERNSSSPLQRFDYAEPAQNANCFGAHVFGTRLVPGEGGAVHCDDTAAQLGQQRSGCTAGGPGPGYEDIYPLGELSQATARTEAR